MVGLRAEQRLSRLVWDDMRVTGVTVGLLALIFVARAGNNDVDDPAKIQFEAAFQGMFVSCTCCF